MKRTLWITLPLVAALMQAQDYQVPIQSKNGPSYTYENYPFPDDIRVYTMDKKEVVLAIDQLTLIQVWSTCCGAEPEVWQRVRQMEADYRDQGLKTVSISFENGSDFPDHHQILVDFFKKVEQPEHFYFDPLGYVIDLLKVRGFPSYYLVDKDGTVVFRTSGKDREGVRMLEIEIQNRLNG